MQMDNKTDQCISLQMCVSVLFQCRITHTPFTLYIENTCRAMCGDEYEEMCSPKVLLGAASLDAHKHTRVVPGLFNAA